MLQTSQEGVKERRHINPGTGDGQQDWLSELVGQAHLTPKGQLVARYIATNPRATSLASVAELGERLQVNPATIVRFAQGLGFSGWREFQLHFRHRYLQSLLPTQVISERLPEGGDTSFERALHRDVQNLQDAWTSLDVAAAETAAGMIAAAQQTLVVTAGSFTAVGLVLAHLGSAMGYRINLETRGGTHLAAALARLQPDDCLVAISFWRIMKQVVASAEHCRSRRVPVVAITDSVFSPLAQEADHVLVVPTESASFFPSTTAAVSLAYGLLERLHELGGAAAAAALERTQSLWSKLDIYL